MKQIAILVLSASAFACGAAGADSSRVPLPAGFHPQAIAAADLDRDGHAAVAICGRDGQFAVFSHGRLDVKPARCGANPFSMIAADVDGDGRPDLVVANHDTDYVTVLKNQGGGRFTARTIRVHSNPHPHMVAAADVNGDGAVDIITDSWAENRLMLLLADGHGGWQSPGVPLDTGRAPYVNVVAADLDGDGHADLILPNARPDDPHDTVTIVFADGHGHFAQPSQIVAGGAPFMVAVADVNGDGRPDIVVVNYSGHITDSSRDGLTWLRNDGGRHFTAFRDRIASGHGTWHLSAGDLNGDRFADAAYINAADGTITVVYGSASGPRRGPTLAVMPHPEKVLIAERRLFVISGDRDELWIVTPAPARASPP